MMSERRLAVGAAAAASGIGFSSGRTIAMFFFQMGWASWIGILTASMLFGLFCAGISAAARSTGAEGLGCVLTQLLGEIPGKLLTGLYGLLTAAVSAVMLSRAGKLAALVLPVYNAYGIGIFAALIAALLLNIRKGRRFLGFGAIVMIVNAAFCLGLFLDSRPIRLYQSFETVAELSGMIPAAIVPAIIYAALCASVAADVLVGNADLNVPVRLLAIYCGVFMAVMLLCGNAAMFRGGVKLLSTAEPLVVLAARWVKFGYYICVLSMFLATVATLTACIGAMIRINAK